MEIESIAGVGPIVADMPGAAALYRDTLGLPLGDDDYLMSDDIDGARHFGIWPLSEAARACFGTDCWPEDRAVPNATIEFEVSSPAAVAEAAEELEAAGHQMLHAAKEEPWGQTIARLQSDDGLLVGISYTPWQHANDGSDKGD